jgi:hypothetical protein
VGRDASALVWIAYVAVPRPAGGVIDGVPLGPLEAAALVAIGWLLIQRAGLAGTRWVAAALAVGFGVSLLVPDHGGFEARYYATPDATGAFERSTEHRGRNFTRIDRAIDFETGHAEFPLAFFNDLGRFNFYQPYEPTRELMAFSVVWDGHWLVESGGAPRELYLDAPGAGAQIVVDGVTVVSVAPLDAAHFAMVTPERGWHTLQVRFTSPYGSPRRLSAGERLGDRRVPFGAPAVSAVRSEPWQVAARPWLRGLTTAIDASVLVWLDVLLLLAIRDAFRRMRAHRPVLAPGQDLLAFLLVAAAIEALVFARPWSSRLMTLVGGDDTLTYESYARQIQLDSFLLAQGGGEPFFYQVLYPYVLAAMHVVFGESMFGPLLVQRLLLALVVWTIVKIAVRIGGEAVWWSALACGVAFAYVLMAPISAKLLNESLFIPLLAAWTTASLSVGASPTPWRAAGAGLLGGVTTLTRSTALLAWPVVLSIWWLSWKAMPRRALLLATMLVCSCSVMSLIAIRNWVVVHELILLPGELPVTLYGGNEPPPGLSIDEERHRALYDRFGLHPFTRQVAEYALTAPGPFLQNLMNKALFALGYFDFYAPGLGYSAGLLMISMGSLAGLLLTIRSPACPLWLALLPVLIALTQYVSVVIVYPKGMRLILPFHALMVPYAAVAVNALWRRAFR